MDEDEKAVDVDRKLFSDEDVIIPEDEEFDEDGIPYL